MKYLPAVLIVLLALPIASEATELTIENSDTLLAECDNTTQLDSSDPRAAAVGFAFCLGYIHGLWEADYKKAEIKKACTNVLAALRRASKITLANVMKSPPTRYQMSATPNCPGTRRLCLFSLFVAIHTEILAGCKK